MARGRIGIDNQDAGTATDLGGALDLVKQAVLDKQTESGFTGPFNGNLEWSWNLDSDNKVSVFGFLMGETTE